MKKKIKEIPVIDRPREKLTKKGRKSLSNVELIAVLLGTGIKGRDVFAVARKIARIAEKDFSCLSHYPLRIMAIT